MKDHESVNVHAPSERVVIGFFRRGLSRIRRWRQAQHGREQLLRLNDAQLRDIGVSRIDIMRECQRPFWDDTIK